MPRLRCLVNKEGCFFIIEFNLCLILLKLNLIHVLNLIQTRVVHQVLHPATLDATFEPESVSINCLFINAVLAFRCIKCDARESAKARSLSFLEIKFYAANEPLATALDLTSWRLQLVAHAIDFTSLDQLISVGLSH